MEQPDRLLDKQSSLGEEIQRSFRNFKKDSSARKTTEDYFYSRLNLLEADWNEFNQNHQKLLAYKEDHADSEYFTKNYHAGIQDLVNQFKELLNQGLAAVQSLKLPKPQEEEPKQGKLNQPDDNNQHGANAAEQQSRSRFELPAPPISPEDPPTEEVVKLIRKQQRTMQVLTRTLQEIASRTQQIRSRIFYELKIQTITRSWEEITENDKSIWEFTQVPLLSYTKEAYDALSDWVEETLVNLHEKLEDSIATPIAQPGLQSQLKLPQITIPVFDGDYIKWPHFHDMFVQVIHSKPISDAEKMFYLTSNLSGEAKILIQHLPTTGANYVTAWEIINNRYNNQRLLSTAFLNRLWDQPIIQGHSASAVKRLHDTTKECLLALRNIGIPTGNWDPFLIHLTIKKLDKATHVLYETSLKSPREMPTIDGMLKFLENRFQTLESLGKENQPTLREQQSLKSSHKLPKAILVASGKPKSCVVCKRNHPLYFCKEFLSQSPSDRRNTLKRHKLCFNCMKECHSSSQCTLRGCTKCSEKHNTLVHIQPSAPAVQNKPAGADVSQCSSTLTAHIPSKRIHKPYILLSTVLVDVINENGESIQCRALLDSGSQLNFATENVVKRLNLTVLKDDMHIQGIGNNKQKVQSRVNLQLRSRVNNYTTRLEAFVLHSIISNQPDHTIQSESWPIPKNISLADPTFTEPGPVDLLIGAEIYFELISIGQIKLGTNLPTLQNTLFGWVVSGRIQEERKSYALCGICSEDERTERQLNRFWELEEIDSSDEANNFTSAERKCVDHFNINVKRDDQGRFVVKLPFSQSPAVLGNSKEIALQKFYSLERRFLRQPEIKEQYAEFIHEYERLGHMKRISFHDIKGPHYFLPHHCVQKLDSSTTKLRVVFDASSKTSSNLSLNDILHKGPTIQDQLFSILIRFRFPRYVFTADIEKMYRQVRLAEDDQIYQLILWREGPEQPIKCFKLCTVTYGLAPAPFLATKCLEQLAIEGESNYPLGSQVLKRDFYVDDVMTGANELHAAITTQLQLKELLQSGGFNLRKWCGNHPQLLRNIPPEDIEAELNFDNPSETSVKTLGLIWHPTSDVFRIRSSLEDTRRITKRSVLSDISHIFDPLGFMSPVTIIAKLFIKQIWTLKMEWDAALPMDMHTSWLKFREDLQRLNDIQVPRHIASGKTPRSIELHAFSDASETAYGAAVYIRAIHQDGLITINLLCAKSKVAPNKTTTLPRLELCAAKLSAQLIDRIRKDIKQPASKIYFWTDSEIVLAWINSESSSYQTFVANRVAAIHRLSNADQWRHVPSKENPADIVSRGMSPNRLGQCTLWFYGPRFLYGNESIWPTKLDIISTDLERRKPRPVLVTSRTESSWIMNINHKNSFQRLVRIVAYVLRFVNLKKHNPQGSHLTSKELDAAVMVIIKHMQQEGFKEDLHQLKKYKSVSSNSSLASLCPFLDDRGIIRVGGRLQNSALSYDAKHPMLLPYGHLLTKLIMVDIHQRNMHIGPQALLAMTRQRYWPIKGKNIARAIVQQCVLCNRTKPQLMSQLMGNLPPTRVQPARPFVNAGVDFCGPIQIHYKLRGKRPQKAYIAVFCCFATKAVHLEVASDLTTDAFLAALKRFTARRGNCRKLFCDNATNFVGGSNKLKELEETIYSDEPKSKIINLCQSKGIDFHFIPPRAPHFGGLWEAAVKSAKALLQRTMAAASLTFEELSTVTSEIEAILNSRPLTPMSADPNDLAALTPGHFLIGEPLTSTIDPQAVPNNTTLLQRWKLVSHIKQEFWKRWSYEYLCELQSRHKWKQEGKNAKPGMMVLIKDDNLPPLKWQLGRIINTIKGADNLVRVADVKTSTNVIRRPIHKLAPLPMEEESKDQDHTCSKPGNDLTANPTPSVGTTNNDSGDQRRARRMQPSTSAAMSLLLLTSLILPIFGAPLAEVKPFESQPGIYFESLGTAHLISNEWVLIIYYDLESLTREFRTITNNINELHNLCTLLSRKDHCSILTTQFNQLQEELISNNELVFATPTSRIKRAPLNVVGKIANMLFDVLDSDYAEALSITIDEVKANEMHLLDLLKNQTSVIDSTINVLKRDEEIIANQSDAINTQLNLLTNRINNITQECYQNQVLELFNTLALQVTLMILKYQRAQSAITNVLVDTHHGKINPLLLSPRQLKNELYLIKDNLPSSLKLPSNSNNLLQLYSLMKVEGRAMEKYIIFRVKMPLFALEDFELFRVLPVPTILNDTFVAIRPTTEFLVINLHRDKYYPLSKQEFALCTTIDEVSHMCTQHHPIYRKGSNISSCELSFMTYSNPANSCEIINAEAMPKWIQLFNPNQWIYSVRSSTVINIVCGSSTIQQAITGSGILTIRNHCEIRHEFLTLHAHNVYPKILKSSFIPTENISDLVSPNHLPILNLTSMDFHNHRTQLKELENQVQHLKENEYLQEGIRPTDVHHFTLGSVAFLIGLAAVISIIYLKYSSLRFKSREQAPIPAPRRSTSRDFTIDIDNDL